jgi:hypothetical protein
MPKFEKLRIKTGLSNEQMMSLAHLLGAEGLCQCGRFLKKTDAKYQLGIFPPPGAPLGANWILMISYCHSCAMAINDLLRYINGRHKHPEADRVRHEGK